MRFWAIGTAAAILALATPVAAGAATWTVDPATPAGCGGADTTCRTLAEAAGAAADGDAVELVAGATHANAGAVTFPQDNLTVRGRAPLVRVRSDAAVTLAFTGLAARLESLAVANGHASGTAVRYTGGGDNRLLRGYVLAEGANGTGVEVLSEADSPVAKTLTIESSVVSGGASGVGLRARTERDTAALGASEAGPISIVARHLTTAGQAKSVVLTADANAAAPCPNGAAVGMTADHSILHPAPNPADRTRFVPEPSDVAHCAAPAPTFPAPAASDTSTPDAALFRAPAADDWLLRADATAVIDRGTDTPATGDADVDGEPRRAGPATDWGADEFVNRPPSVALATAPASARPGETVAASAEGSSDPEAGYGGGTASVRFDWGDGTAPETGTQTARAHAYAAPGDYTVTVTVTDAQGATAARSGRFQIVAPSGSGGGGIAPGLTSITQLPGFEAGIDPLSRRGPDTEPPYVTFTSPRPHQGIRLRRGRPPALRGRTADLTGVRRIDLALMRREGTRCRWFDGRAFRLGRCTAPVWFKAVLDDFDWRYAFPRAVRPRAGSYFGFVRATDYLGQRTTTFDAGSSIAFRYVAR